MVFRNYFNKSKLYILFLLILLSSCVKEKDKEENTQVVIDFNEIYIEKDNDRYIETVMIDTNIGIIPNVSTSILFKTNENDYSEFCLKDGYINYRAQGGSNILIVSSIDDLNKMWEYFHFPYLNNFSASYLEKYFLILILLNFSGGDYIKNGRIEQYNEKYFLVAEYWNRPGARNYIGSLYRTLYVLEISKE
jgi:hypothetical protein